MRISGTAQVILEIRGLEAGYGKHLILHGVDLEVHRGSVVAVLAEPLLRRTRDVHRGARHGRRRAADRRSHQSSLQAD